MSEWSIVQSWNGCVLQGTPGSNPGLCANVAFSFVVICDFFILRKEGWIRMSGVVFSKGDAKFIMFL